MTAPARRRLRSAAAPVTPPAPVTAPARTNSTACAPRRAHRERMERMRFGDVPALVAHQARPEDAAARGTVLLYHPLGKAKELHSEDVPVCSPTPASSQSVSTRSPTASGASRAATAGSSRTRGRRCSRWCPPRSPRSRRSRRAGAAALGDPRANRHRRRIARRLRGVRRRDSRPAHRGRRDHRRVAAVERRPAQPPSPPRPLPPTGAPLDHGRATTPSSRPRRSARSTGTWSRSTPPPPSACATSSSPASRTGCPTPRGTAPARRRSAGSTGSSWARAGAPDDPVPAADRARSDGTGSG